MSRNLAYHMMSVNISYLLLSLNLHIDSSDDKVELWSVSRSVMLKLHSSRVRPIPTMRKTLGHTLPRATGQKAPSHTIRGMTGKQQGSCRAAAGQLQGSCSGANPSPVSGTAKESAERV